MNLLRRAAPLAILASGELFVLVSGGFDLSVGSLETLTVVGAQFAEGKPGFVVLNARADVGTGAFIRGEELQDHSCAAARE